LRRVLEPVPVLPVPVREAHCLPPLWLRAVRAAAAVQADHCLAQRLRAQFAYRLDRQLERRRKTSFRAGSLERVPHWK
jgi:hypothetical protein